MEFINQCNATYNEYSLFIMPINEQSSNQTWSPFSTPSISPYGSPPQTAFNYSTPVSNTAESQSYIQPTYFPTPISRPLKRNYNLGHNKTTKSSLPKRSEQVDMSNYIRNSSSGRSKMCTFCKSNGESEQIFMSHSLKNSLNKITCPVLMQYTCVECGASGENTHTIKYCPVMQKKLRNKLLNNIKMSNDDKFNKN